MRRFKLSVWSIGCICLAALSIGLIILNVLNFNKLQQYESTYALTSQGLVNETQQQTIDSLSNEVVSLKEQLQVSDTVNQKQLLADMSAFISKYYLVDETHLTDARLNAVKPYVTDHLFSNLSLKFNDDTVSVQSKYQSSVQIHETYITPILDGDTNIKVLLYCTVSINTTWGKTSNDRLISIDAKYDSVQEKWFADSLTAAGQVVFDAM